MCRVSMRIKNKESCPCGSGLLFFECCKERSFKVNPSPKPPQVQAMEMMLSNIPKCCMHPDHEHCHGGIRKAHALQCNKIISLLAGEDHHVYMLATKKRPELLPLKNGSVSINIKIDRVGVNDATTENCFCKRHDDTVFEVIEKGAPDFDPTSEEMKFVYAYKAFIFEYYKAWTLNKVFQKCFKSNPPAFRTRNDVGFYRMIQQQMKELEPVKAFFDSHILKGSYGGLYSCVIRIPKRVKFSDYAYFAPDFDLNGNRIKHTDKGIMHRIALTVIPEALQSWVVLSCREYERQFYDDFFNQLSVASIDRIQYYLNMVLPLYSENIVLSPALWESWDEMTQIVYTSIANLYGNSFVKCRKAIGMGLRNASRDKTRDAFDTLQRIDFFT